MPRERVAQVALVAYMLWLLSVALGPAPQGPDIPYVDKVMHALSWGLMAALCLGAWPERWRLALLVPGLHGGLTEVLQGTVVSGRSAEWLDWLADLLGAALVVGFVSWARRRRSAAA